MLKQLGRRLGRADLLGDIHAIHIALNAGITDAGLLHHDRAVGDDGQGGDLAQFFQRSQCAGD